MYARGFLNTRRDEVKFLWRSHDGWLAVRIDRQHWQFPREQQAVLSFAPTTLPENITQREIDILTLVALGLTNGQIAMRLGTSVRTVSSQVERLLNKLGQTGRGGLAALAVDAALLRLPIPGGATGLTCTGPVEVEQHAARVGRDRLASQPVTVAFPTRRPLLLGTLTPLSGAAAADGIEVSRGAALAVQEINARGGIGGRPIEHVVVDADIFDQQAVRRMF